MKNFSRAWRHALIVMSIGTLTSCGGGGNPPALALQATGIKTLRLSWPDTPGALSYRILFAADGVQNAELKAELPANTTQHTFAAFLPALVNGRYTVQSCRLIEATLDCVEHVSAVVDSAVLNAAIGYFKASNQSAGLGASVALSSDGRTMAIGAPGDDSAATGIDGNASDISANGSGAVYVFVRGAQGWMRQAYIKPLDTTAFDEFGQSVALSADGRRLAVAATRRHSFDGAVYLFERSGASWSQQVQLTPPTADQGARFGKALALAGDGTTLAVGENEGFATAAAVHVYSYTASGWSVVPQTLPSPEPADLSSTFGSALAMAGDGNTLAVGARSQRTTPTATAGAAYVYTRGAGGWALQTRLLASNSGDADDFGCSTALSSDGATLAVGACSEDSPATGVNGPQDNGMINSGAAYVFTQTGGSWAQQAYIKASNTHEFNYFGRAVALSADGIVLAVGADEERGSDHGLGGNGADNATYARSASGAAYVFQRRIGGWHQTAYVKALQADAYDRFGQALALSGDGQTLAIGAPSEDSASLGIGGDASDNSASGSGAIYLY